MKFLYEIRIQGVKIYRDTRFSRLGPDIFSCVRVINFINELRCYKDYFDNNIFQI